MGEQHREPGPGPGPPALHRALGDAEQCGDRSGEIDTAITVRRALMRLPAGQRAAVLAVDMLGYSVSEAAALLGVAEGTVKSRRARAR
ncbi:MAG: hypothetical protein EBU23_06165, partial [Mycobacteriaceae bacterium]|nr:hypothetical protein [Mycobacteriaceae bacterium]